MKTKKCLASVFLATAVLLSSVGFSGCNKGINGIVYKVSEDGTYAMVTDCSIFLKNAVIMDTYEGLPVTTIATAALSYSNIQSVVIPDSVTTIETFAFHRCYKLENVQMGKNVETLGDEVFESCSQLTSITLPDSLISIGRYAFYYCESLTSITIPDSVITLGDCVFQCCSNLANVQIGSSVTTIGEDMFSLCGSLSNISVNSENAYFQSIDGNLYTKDGTTFLQYAPGKQQDSFVIPDGVTTVSNHAFSHSHFLYLTIPQSVTTIKANAFEYFNDLRSISVDAENAYFQSIDGDLYTKDGTTFLQYAHGKQQDSFAIPDGVTTIGDFAFKNCDNLTSVIIPDSVTTIGSEAFEFCYNLTSVIIGNGVTTIADWAFEFCDNLTAVYYKGSADDWAKITMGKYTSKLQAYTRYYYSETQPTTNGNFWHYDENLNPVIW